MTPCSTHFVRRSLPLALAALLLTAACGAAPEPSAVGADALGGRQQSPHGAHGAAAAVPATAPPTPASPSEAVELRSTLERLLGEHVLVADEFVRATLMEQNARATAAWDGVDRNQRQLEDAVTSLAGAATGERRCRTNERSLR